MTATEAAGRPQETRLKAGAVRLPGAIMQNVTHIAPAVAAFFFTQTIVGFAGGHAPLAYLLGFILVLALGMCLVQLAKNFPSAGGYFTYVSRTIGPRTGFLTGWMFVFYSPIVGGPLIAYLGWILQGELKTQYQVTWYHWWMLVVVLLPIIAYVGYRGIAPSVRMIIVVGAIEFVIVLALGISGLVSPGPGGFTTQSFTYGFNPAHIATASGFTLAIVFTVQGLTGWEAAAPLAEETDNPKRNIPLATMISIAIIGTMLVLTIWGQVIGWGTEKLPSLISSAEIPALVIARRVWGGLWFLRPDRDDHLVDRRERRVSERGDAHVVRDGPQRRAAEPICRASSDAAD
ncbi:MAG: APC family permease, partial [Solirubrobacteraceae bacterium]